MADLQPGELEAEVEFRAVHEWRTAAWYHLFGFVGGEPVLLREPLP